MTDGPAEPFYRPGEHVPASGIYSELDFEGDPVGHQATCVEGEPFPPTGEDGNVWVLSSASSKHIADLGNPAGLPGSPEFEGVFRRWTPEQRALVYAALVDVDPTLAPSPGQLPPLIAFPEPVVFMITGAWCRHAGLPGNAPRTWFDQNRGERWDITLRLTVCPFLILTRTADARNIERAQDDLPALDADCESLSKQAIALESDLANQIPGLVRQQMERRYESVSRDLREKKAALGLTRNILRNRDESTWVFRLDIPLGALVLPCEDLSAKEVMELPLGASIDDLQSPE